MEIAAIILSALSFIGVIVILIILLKNNNQKTNALSKGDVKEITDAVTNSVNTLSKSTAELIAEKNNSLLESLKSDIKKLNEAMDSLSNSFKTFKTENTEFKLQFFEENKKQKEELLKSVKEKVEEFKTETKETIKDFKETLNKNLDDIRKDNSEKLDKIKDSVNEKLEKALEEKLKSSFDNIIKQIGAVNETVGEIKGLANDVGSLKNVLTNVKTKGILGEVILGNIIKEFLTVNQYEENVATIPKSTNRVEYAIKLPGNGDSTIYLPVDSKFPYEPYSKLISSNSTPEEIEQARKTFKNNLKDYAKDVSKKYIEVPYTTEFGIIFLPTEGLYLEAINMGLFEEIQKDYKINIVGPTTFTAFVSSLQMGFKTLTIQKKTKEVVDLLKNVKKEFANFAEAIEKTQKKIDDASEQFSTLVTTRSHKLEVQLRKIDLDSDYEEEEIETSEE